MTRCNILAKHTVLVANAVADHRQAQRRAAVEKAGGKPSQSAVTQPGIVLLFDDLFFIESKLVERRAQYIVELQVQGRVAQASTEQVLHRQVTAPPAIPLFVTVTGIVSAVHETVAQRHGQRNVFVMR